MSKTGVRPFRPPMGDTGILDGLIAQAKQLQNRSSVHIYPDGMVIVQMVYFAKPEHLKTATLFFKEKGLRVVHERLYPNRAEDNTSAVSDDCKVLERERTMSKNTGTDEPVSVPNQVGDTQPSTPTKKVGVYNVGGKQSRNYAVKPAGISTSEGK